MTYTPLALVHLTEDAGDVHINIVSLGVADLNKYRVDDTTLLRLAREATELLWRRGACARRQGADDALRGG